MRQSPVTRNKATDKATLNTVFWNLSKVSSIHVWIQLTLLAYLVNFKP